MDDLEGEAASTRQTLAYCAGVARPYARMLVLGAVALVVAVTITDVATPIVFAAVLDRIATLHPGAHLWRRFGSLIITYAVLLVAGQAVFRMAGWFGWEGAIKTFANSIHASFDKLLALGYRWHIDHPSGEVASAMSAFAWALVDGIDTLQWGVLRIFVVAGTYRHLWEHQSGGFLNE